MLDRVESQIRVWIDELESRSVNELFVKLPKGKRLRAKLILKIAGISDESIKLAAIIEMIHAASLLHDDVIDEAIMRRGVKSLNATEGSKQAVMLGDILYSKGFEELVLFKKEIVSIVAGAVTKLSIGELMDVGLSKIFNPNIDEYMKMVYQKTAALIEASAYSAAILAKKDEKVYAKYGRNLGIAFQIIDDILDVVSNSKQLGKPVMADFEEGKTTLPYIYLYESLEDDDKDKLIKLHGVKLTEEQKLWIRKTMHKSGALKKAKDYAKKLGDEAIALMVKEGEDTLVEIATAMIERDF